MNLTEQFKKEEYKPVVYFDKDVDRLLLMNFTEANKELTADIIADTDKFSTWVNYRLQTTDSRLLTTF